MELDKIADFNHVFKCLRRDVDRIENHCNLLKKTIVKLDKKCEYQCAFYTHRIVRDIMKNICSGFNESVAVGLVADDYCPQILRREDVQKIWNRAKREKNALIMYGRVFTAKKMKLSGFSISEIACTLGISKTSIQNLLKSQCNID